MPRRIEVQITGNSRDLERAFGRAASSGRNFGSSIGRVGGALSGFAKTTALVAGGAALGGLALTLRAGVKEFAEQAQVAAQTEAVLKSTGAAAGITAEHVDKLAQSIMAKTGIDDEAVKKTENLLLGFTNLRNEVGKGNDVFDRATMAVQDYSARTGKDGTAAARALGRALSDPAKNLSALTRLTGGFTEAQKKQIVALGKSGDALGAQRALLEAVELRYKGAAEAAGGTLTGKVNILRESFNNLAAELVGGLAPAFTRVIAGLSGFVGEVSQAKGLRAKLNVVWEGVQEAGTTLTAKLGEAIRGVDWAAAWAQASGIAEGLAERFKGLDWTAIGTAIGDGISTAVAGAATAGQKLAGALAGVFRSIDWVSLGKSAGPGLAAAIVVAFTTLMDPSFWIKNWDLALAVALTVFGKGIGKLVAPLGRLIRTSLGQAFESGILAVAGVVERVFGTAIGSAVLAGLARLPAIVSRALGALAGVVTAVFSRLGRIAQFVVKVLGLQAAIGAITKFASWVKEKIDDVVGWFKKLPDRISSAVGDLSGLLVAAGSAVLQGLINGAKSKLGDVKDFFTGVGESIVGWKGPLDKDKALLVPAGLAIMDGLIAGLGSRLPALKAQMGRITAQIAAINDQRATEDRARAVSEAAQALAAAKKSGEGVVQAQRDYDRARQDIVIAGMEKQLAAEQAAYDKQKAAQDKALEARKTALQRWADQMKAANQTAVDNLGTAWGKLTTLAQQAFSAIGDSWKSDAQKEIDAIGQARQFEDLAQAVADAQKALDEAVNAGPDPTKVQQAQERLAAALADKTPSQGAIMAAQDALAKATVGPDPEVIAEAQKRLNRAIEDQQINGPGGLAERARNEEKAHTQEQADRDRRFTDEMAKLGTQLATKKITYGTAMDEIVALLNSYGVDFAAAGGVLGEAFAEALREKIQEAAATAGVRVSGAGGNRPDNRAIGGGATVFAAAPARATAGIVVNVNAGTVVGSGGMQELASTVRSEIERINSRNAI